MKQCSKCRSLKPFAEFSKRSSTADGLQTMCKTCFKENWNVWYEGNKDREIARAIENNKKRIKTNRVKLLKLLMDNPCACGESNPLYLQFHHRDPTDKEHNIATMVAESYGWETVLQEVAKCDILCVKCHIDLTSVQQGNWKIEALKELTLM